MPDDIHADWLAVRAILMKRPQTAMLAQLLEERMHAASLPPLIGLAVALLHVDAVDANTIGDDWRRWKRVFAWGRTTPPDMLFERVGDKYVPVLPTRANLPDGERYFGIRDTAEKTCRPRGELETEWRAWWPGQCTIP